MQADVSLSASPVLWVILSIFCGAVIFGVFAYLIAWLIIPPAPGVALSTTAHASP